MASLQNYCQSVVTSTDDNNSVLQSVPSFSKASKVVRLTGHFWFGDITNSNGNQKKIHVKTTTRAGFLSLVIILLEKQLFKTNNHHFEVRGNSNDFTGKKMFLPELIGPCVVAF